MFKKKTGELQPAPSKQTQTWTEADFDAMNWQHVRMHGFASIPERRELLFDIDYILQQKDPFATGSGITFLVAPATLVFWYVSELDVQLSSQDGTYTIHTIQRTNEQLTPDEKTSCWMWMISGNEGSILFRAAGYRQFLRKRPMLVATRQLSYAQRGGISFSRESQQGF